MDAPYGAKGDGVTDDTNAIARAINDAASESPGGTIFFPEGTYLTGPQTLYSHVHLVGAGSGTTIIKLKNGANADLFSAQTSSINLSASFGTGIVGTLSRFAIKNLTLDGNRANQSAGPSYPLRFYGYDFFVDDLEIKNGYSGGYLSDWNGGNIVNIPNNMEARLSRIKIHDCNGIGFQMGGPNDSHLYSVFVWSCTSHGFHFCPNAVGSLCFAIHPYGLSTGNNAVGVLAEAQNMSFIGCMIEGSDYLEMAIIVNDISIIGGDVFGNPQGGYQGIGIQLGQRAGDTPLSGQIFQSGGVTLNNAVVGCNLDCKTLNNTNGAVYFRNENNNHIRIKNYQTSGGFLHSGAGPDSTDFLMVQQSGMTPDFTINTQSFLIMPSNAPFSIDQYGAIGTYLFAADAITARSYISQTLTTGATISVPSNSSLHITETGNVTGIILAKQPGYRTDMLVCIVNESAFSVTFATQATSNIAGSTGSNVVIAANSKAIFWWDSNTQLWYV